MRRAPEAMKIQALFGLAFLILPGLAQEPTRDAAVTLADVRGLFARVDADKSLGLGVAEAAKAGIGRDVFPGADLDGDGSLSRDEFVLARRRVLAASGAKVAADLDAEVARLHALRKAEGIRSRRAGAQDASKPASGLDAKAQDARGDLNRRLRNANGVDRKTVDEQQAALNHRIQNAKAQRDAAGGARNQPTANGAAPVGGGEPAAPASREGARQSGNVTGRIRPVGIQRGGARQAREPGQGDAGPAAARRAGDANPDVGQGMTLDERVGRAQRRLERRLTEQGADAETIRAEREKLGQRIRNARRPREAPTEDTEAATGDGAAAPRAPRTAEERAQDAREALNRRLRNAGVDRDQARAAQERLQQRIRNAQGTPADGQPPAEGAAPEAGGSAQPAGAQPARPASPAGAKPGGAQPARPAGARPVPPRRSRATPAQPAKPAGAKPVPPRRSGATPAKPAGPGAQRRRSGGAKPAARPVPDRPRTPEPRGSGGGGR